MCPFFPAYTGVILHTVYSSRAQCWGVSVSVKGRRRTNKNIITLSGMSGTFCGRTLSVRCSACWQSLLLPGMTAAVFRLKAVVGASPSSHPTQTARLVSPLRTHINHSHSRSYLWSKSKQTVNTVLQVSRVVGENQITWTKPKNTQAEHGDSVTRSTRYHRDWLGDRTLGLGTNFGQQITHIWPMIIC